MDIRGDCHHTQVRLPTPNLTPNLPIIHMYTQSIHISFRCVKKLTCNGLGRNIMNDKSREEGRTTLTVCAFGKIPEHHLQCNRAHKLLK